MIFFMLLICSHFGDKSIMARVNVLNNTEDHSGELESSLTDLDGARIVIKDIDTLRTQPLHILRMAFWVSLVSIS